MGEHAVQFYEDETFLLDRIWNYIAPPLQAGHASIVIALPARLDHIGRLFGHHGTPPEAYVALDAEELLECISAGSSVDEALFRKHVCPIIERAGRHGLRSVYIYGEMVALLCARGHANAAIRLEALWNNLSSTHDFSLLCAYPISAFSEDVHSKDFHDVCGAHAHIRAAETGFDNTEDMQRTIALLQQKTSALEAEASRRQKVQERLRQREQDLIRDVAERTSLQEELNRKLEELASLDRRKDEFLAMLGHELRNPLAPILASLELMRLHDPDKAELDRLREIIFRQASSMSRLVDDLLDVSRITRGTIELRHENVTLEHIVERAVEVASPLINERGHHLNLSLPEESITLHGDPVRLAQVVANLLHNAAKYTEPGGRICVAARKQESVLELAISDNGIGLEPDLQDKMFDLFVQGAGSLSKARGGLGLGLTLVRSLVHMHGGTVDARSDGCGQGSVFNVRLPLTVGRTCAPAKIVPIPADTHDARPRNILIVDDNADAAESLAELLKAIGHMVHITYDGKSALEVAPRLKPEAVILDIGMPDMSGYQVAQLLRADVELTSVLLVAVSGYAQEQDRLSARAAGFDHHFAKPIDIPRLITILSESR